MGIQYPIYTDKIGHFYLIYIQIVDVDVKRRVVFWRAVFSRVVFSRAVFSRVKFSRGVFYRAYISEWDFDECIFS